MPQGPFHSSETLKAMIATHSESTDPLFYAITSNESSKPVGYASLMRIDVANRVIEVGSIMYSLALKQSTAATEAMYLLAKYVFESLGYRRYEWKCNNHNEASKRAAERLGFTFEGIFRQHMIVKGENRDTAWYSMLDFEWPAIKRALELWLDPSNFDVSGRQLRRLEDLRAGALTA